jgi:hypothetical protein
MDNHGSSVPDNGICCTQAERDRAVTKAIDLASAETLRRILKNVYGAVPNVKQTLEEALLAVEGNGGEGPDCGKNLKKRYSSFDLATGANKRLRPRYVSCEQCRKEFDVTKNHDKACFWHEGYLEINHEHNTWDDWEEETRGDHDTDENREEYPEGFTWNCCDKDGRGEGCMTTAHKFEFSSSKSEQTKLFGSPKLEFSSSRSEETKLFGSPKLGKLSFEAK